MAIWHIIWSIPVSSFECGEEIVFPRNIQRHISPPWLARWMRSMIGELQREDWIVWGSRCKARSYTNLPFGGFYVAECDISVSKLLGLETFPFFRWYRHRFRYRKKYRYRFWKILVSIKVSVLVSKKVGIRAFCFWPLSIYFGPKVLNMAEKLWVSAL